jgi:hypothetical protein
MKRLDYIIENAIMKLIEQDVPPEGGDAADAGKKKETDNAPSDAEVSPFTPAEEKFLGKFDAYGTTHLGIIYSPTDIGIREFLGRSGNDLNCTPGILLKLLRNKIIKIVPYTGFGRNTDYTIELQLSLDDVKGLGKEDKEKAEAGSSASGAPTGGGEAAAPAPEVAWFVPKGTLIRETNTNEFDEFIKLLAEAKDTEIKPGKEKQYLISKYPGIDLYVDRALNFWNDSAQYIPSVTVFGKWNWDESKFTKSVDDNLLKDGQRQAMYIDAIGQIIKDSTSTIDDIAEPAVKFLLQFQGSDYDVVLNLSVLGDRAYRLKYLFDNELLYSVFDDDPKWFKKFKSVIQSSKIGYFTETTRNMVRKDDGGKEITFAQQFYPAYSEAQISALVNKILTPYKLIIKRGNKKVDTTKITLRDTLTNTQIKSRAKYAKSLINKDIKKYFTGYKPKGLELGNMDWPNIEDIPFYKGAWVDKDGFGYVWFQIDTATSARLYPSKKGVLANTKTGKITKTGKWNLIWDRGKQRWGIQVQ